MAGTYDGASVPVFGQLAGLDGNGLDDQSAAGGAGASRRRQTLPAAALAAVVALAAVTAALVRTHQASRASALRPAAAAVAPRDGGRVRVPGPVWTAPAGRRAAAGSLVPRVPAPAGARNACTTLLLQIYCSRPDQRRWGSPCVITN